MSWTTECSRTVVHLACQGGDWKFDEEAQDHEIDEHMPVCWHDF